MNTCANRLSGDIRTVEPAFLEDINICLDLNIIGTVFSSRVICNGINEIANMN